MNDMKKKCIGDLGRDLSTHLEDEQAKQITQCQVKSNLAHPPHDTPQKKLGTHYQAEDNKKKAATAI